MQPKIKIAIVALVVVAVIVALYFLLRKKKIFSSETIAAAKSGNYGTWGSGASPDWSNFVQKSIALFGKGKEIGVEGGENQAYVSGALKGLNMERSAANLETFSADLKTYLQNTSGRKYDWIAKQGEFL